MSEENLWNRLRGLLPRGHYTRIESGETGPGFPDVHYQLPVGSTGTIELKFARHPRSVRPFKRDGLRPSQLRWIEDNLHNGGTVWIIAQVGSEVFVMPGPYFAAFNESTKLDLRENADLVFSLNKPTQGEIVYLGGLLIRGLE